VTDPAQVEVPPYYPDTPVVRRALARMYDNVAEMDRQVAEILRQLEEDGLADDTIVFFWSDHGDGLPRAKRALYDSGLHVPLMIRCPARFSCGTTPGSANDELVSFVDLAPTVLALADVPVPVTCTGACCSAPAPRRRRPTSSRARDRMDLEYGTQRSARDARFLYIRNLQPELEYAGHVPYRNSSPIMEELLRLQAEGTLTGPPALWMRSSRPPEELYDVRADPHQVRDLAEDPAHRATLEAMRHALEAWMARIGDQGLMNEAELVQRMWPGRVQPVTSAPYIVARGTTEAPARAETLAFSSPMELIIYAPTQGASVGYTTEEGPDARWRLYTGPIRVTAPVTVRAKAIRYGYQESAETRVVVAAP
jgi:N-sulfoglucosamine sulfohydrolase